jgi:hypothetical protein
MWVENYPRELDAALFIIRYAYSLGGEVAIPSEILADFQMRRRDGVWVDSFIWPEADHPDEEIVIGAHPVMRPRSRRIQFPQFAIPPKGYKQKKARPKRTGAPPELPEVPTSRFIPCPRDWEDRSDPGFQQMLRWDRRSGTKDKRPDTETVFTLSAGEEAISLFGDPEKS